MKTNQIFHPYWLWEDYKHGFYENCSGLAKEQYIEKVIEMFECEHTTRKFMLRVIDEWKFSCEQNLTNPSMNKIAYIGQAACCLYANVPNTVTMNAWNLLDTDTQDRSNKIAKEVLDTYFKKNNYE